MTQKPKLWTFNLRKVNLFSWNKVVENTATKHTSMSFFHQVLPGLQLKYNRMWCRSLSWQRQINGTWKQMKETFDNFTSAVMCYSAAILNSPTVISKDDDTCLARTWTRRVYLLAWSYTRNYHGYILRIGAKCSSSVRIHTRCSAETIAITMQIVVN